MNAVRGSEIAVRAIMVNKLTTALKKINALESGAQLIRTPDSVGAVFPLRWETYVSLNQDTSNITKLVVEEVGGFQDPDQKAFMSYIVDDVKLEWSLKIEIKQGI